MLEDLKNKNMLVGESVRFNINDSIMELRKKFLEIREMGYVKSIRNGTSGIGVTFESLLGKEEDVLELPDFKGIEIKTRRPYSRSLINLFKAVPMGDTDYELKRIRDKYGYPDSNDRNLKRFGATISSDSITKVGLFYKFKIKVDRQREKVILCVYDWNDICIDESSYWNFSVIREKLFRKLGILALVKAWPNRINGEEYFKYYKMNFYILREFEFFLDALEKGYVKILFNIGNYYDEERYGNVRGHGVGFVIAEEDLDKIFELYR